MKQFQAILFFTLLTYSTLVISQPADNSQLGRVKDISSSLIKKYKIGSIIHSIVQYDSLEQPNNSFLQTISYYDTSGRLTEVKQDFKDGGMKYGKIKYFYNKDGYLIQTTSENILIDFIYTTRKPYTICNKYDKNGILQESTEVFTDEPEKIIVRKVYEYIYEIPYLIISYNNKNQVTTRDLLELVHY